MTDIISHRGGALLWPENSRAAVLGTIALGVEEVQLDIHVSADGHVIVIHDATLDRTTDATGPVATRNWAELSQICLRDTGDERLPGLDEMLDLLRPSGLTLRLELKSDAAQLPYPQLLPQTLATLRAGAMLDRTVLTGFRLDSIAAGLNIGRRDRHCWMLRNDVITDVGFPTLVATAHSHGIPALALRWTALTPERLQIAHNAGLRLGCFGCHDTPSLSQTLALTPDDLSTDRPDLALHLRLASGVAW